MERTLVVGTSNSGKKREIIALLEGAPIRLAFSDCPSPEETGTTFFANALIKARATAAHSSDHYPTNTLYAGEDSGICVPALFGSPGVLSARYSLLPEQQNFAQSLDPSFSVDNANNLCLLHALAPLPQSSRAAYYESRLVIVDNGGEVIGVTSGRAHGSILETPRGSGGFGYDPLFVDSEGACWGEIDSLTKNQRSHRAKAFQALLAILAHFE